MRHTAEFGGGPACSSLDAQLVAKNAMAVAARARNNFIDGKFGSGLKCRKRFLDLLTRELLLDRLGHLFGEPF